MTDKQESQHLRKCIELAEEALNAGDDPFGSVLVDASGHELQSSRNRINTGPSGDNKADALFHPEIELARWAQANLSPEARARTTMYTSGEHCPMCSTAHSYCGLGRIVFIASCEQYKGVREEFGLASNVAFLGIRQVTPDADVKGPISPLAQEVIALYRRRLDPGRTS